jgi:hypothetical protein
MATKDAVAHLAVPAPIPKTMTFRERLPAPLLFLLLAPVLLLLAVLAVFEVATVGRLRDRA